MRTQKVARPQDADRIDAIDHDIRVTESIIAKERRTLQSLRNERRAASRKARARAI